jgi:hypothetical protein
VINEQADSILKEKELALNLEIEHKNRELTSIAMALAQEMNSSITSSLNWRS